MIVRPLEPNGSKAVTPESRIPRLKSWEYANKLQILATMDDGTHLMAITDDKILIRFVAELCQFVKIKEDLFEQCSLKELVE